MKKMYEYTGVSQLFELSIWLWSSPEKNRNKRHDDKKHEFYYVNSYSKQNIGAKLFFFRNQMIVIYNFV